MTVKRKIALVTGGSRGLGKDMVLSLGRRGFDVVLTYRTSEEQAHEVVQELEKLGVKAAALQLNLSLFGSLNEFVTRFEAILDSKWATSHFDFLINNAGMGATVPIEKVTEEIFDDFLNVHFKGVYFLTQRLIGRMNSGGRVINISSGTTRFSNPGYSVYASMKGAIEVLTKYIAKEFGAKGIGANVVAPGPIETDFNHAAIRSNPQFKTMLSGLTALGRVGSAEDVGGVVAFLCSEEGRWINGQRIEVSGGINV